MITEEYLKNHFINAYFVDNERTQIAILSTDPEEGKKVIETVIEYDMEHPFCQALFTIVDLDGLHESTYQRNLQERKMFEEMVLRIARKDGIIVETNKVDSKFFNMMVESIFNHKEDDKETIFALKIALFELDFIKESKNNELKSKLRKSKTVYETMVVAFEMFELTK